MTKAIGPPVCAGSLAGGVYHGAGDWSEPVAGS